MKYVFMNGHQGTFRVSAMSRILQVSRSGLYAWCKRRDNPSPRQQHRQQLDTAVKKAFDAGKSRSGSPRLVLNLAEAGHRHDRKTIAERVNDTMLDVVWRFLQAEERFVAYPMPLRGTYRRDFTFTDKGWACTANNPIPASALEGGVAELICIDPGDNEVAVATGTSEAAPTATAQPNTESGWYWSGVERIGITNFSSVILLPPG